MKYNPVDNIVAISAAQTQNAWIWHKFTENTKHSWKEAIKLWVLQYSSRTMHHEITWNNIKIIVLYQFSITKSHSHHNELPGGETETQSLYGQETASSNPDDTTKVQENKTVSQGRRDGVTFSPISQSDTSQLWAFVSKRVDSSLLQVSLALLWQQQSKRLDSYVSGEASVSIHLHPLVDAVWLESAS